MALTNKLTAIANAIRSKTGKTETMTLDQMPTEIESISGGGLEPFEFNARVGGNRFSSQSFMLLLKELGEGAITKIVVTGSGSPLYGAFQYAPDIGFKIPNIIYNRNSSSSLDYMFANSMIKTENLPKIILSGSANSISHLFDSSALEYIPEDFFDSITCGFQKTVNNCGYVFQSCPKLRRIPKKVLEKISNRFYSNYPSYSTVYYAFRLCYVLDELDGIKLGGDTDGPMQKNVFVSTFSNCSRLKRVVFLMNGNKPYVLRISSQTIDLSSNVGYASQASYITSNSSMTTANKVTDDASYNNLKNTEDWFTTDVNYSRYNRISAVETINSLPDTSAYLASAGGTNTIKFKGASGSKTDGGAINTMTAEEIAIATAKGWTVTFV